MVEIIGGYFMRKVVSSEERQIFLQRLAFHNASKNPWRVHWCWFFPRRQWLTDFFYRPPQMIMNRILDSVTWAVIKRIVARNQKREPRALAPIPPAMPLPHEAQIKPFQCEPKVSDFLASLQILDTPEIEAYENNLTDSIDKLEKIVKRNLKRQKMISPCVSKRESRVRALMSMR